MTKLNTIALRRLRERGFILPTTIILGLGLAIISVTYAQFIAITSSSLNTRNYNSLASEAARAGIKYAISCIKSNENHWPNPLKPDTDCTGGPNSSVIYVSENTEWRSTFNVPDPVESNGILTVTSTGTIEQLSGNEVVKTYTGNVKTTLPSTVTTLPISTGESVTNIKNDNADCAIANGKLYCWGDNTAGQLGQGDTTSRSTPTLVQGALAGKTVTKVSVAQNWIQVAGVGVNIGDSVCAIADGTPYCWGDNSYKQLGYSGGDVHIPTNNIPRTSSGPLAGKTVVDIGTAATNNPASFLWPYARADPHSCALTDDGAVSCWGDGDFRQLTGGTITPTINWVCDPIFQWICAPWPGFFYDYPSHTYPTLVKGYSDNTGPFAGKKAVRAGASSHDSCLVAQGELFCMGVPAPINIICNSVLFSGASDTLIWLNPCIGGYSNGYNVSSAAFWGLIDTPLSGDFIDPDSWEVSSNETCMMADTNFVCFGQSPAFNVTWLDAWSVPWTAISNADVTSHDNGDNTLSGGVLALYCVINKGVAECSGTIGNVFDGSAAVASYKQFHALTETGSNGVNGLNGADGLDDTLDDMIPTAIAAGLNHGCLSANGQLLCWGAGYSTYATVQAASSIGTAAGTLAANGPVSIGENHACGVVNGKLFCWGDNSYGQLGFGKTGGEKSKPQAVPSLSNYTSVTKVSAGDNHTCAIIYGDLYCWGRNNHGQLGLNDSNDRNIPTLVANSSGQAFYNKRVTDVSAGANGTCAIADGQAYCWGLNSNRQLGTGDVTSYDTPQLVDGGTGSPLVGKSTTSISMGDSHACAVANADLYCWGNNANGRTGLGTTSGNSDPTQVTGGTTNTPRGPNNMRPAVSSVSAGSDFTCAIIQARISCWGNNANGRTGLGTTSSNQTTPANISGTPGSYYATKISAGGSHACAVLNGGSSATNSNLYCWGAGSYGQIGNNSSADRSTATIVNGGETIDSDVVDPLKRRRVATSVAAGNSSSCAVANAVILCWGAGANGRLGNGSSANIDEPDTTSSYEFATPFVKGPIF